MADLFLSYTHGDRERARPIVEMLEAEGWTVWWDRGIEPGMEWLPEPETELADTRAVVVLWSKTSVKSEWVMREAAAGLRKNGLVPILLEGLGTELYGLWITAVSVAKNGVFGGFAVGGALINLAADANHAYYGESVTPRDIVKGNVGNPRSLNLRNAASELITK